MHFPGALWASGSTNWGVQLTISHASSALPSRRRRSAWAWERWEDTQTHVVPLIFLVTTSPPARRTEHRSQARKFRYSIASAEAKCSLAAGWTCCCCWYTWCSGVRPSACRSNPSRTVCLCVRVSVSQRRGCVEPTSDSSDGRRLRLQHMGGARAPARTFRRPTRHRPEWSWSAATTTVAIRCSKEPWPGTVDTADGRIESDSCVFFWK